MTQIKEKIAFKLSTPEAVEYANAYRSWFKYNYDDFTKEDREYYFHLPHFRRQSFATIQPGYTDVTKDFKETYWRPWKDKLASDNAPSISGGDAPLF
jgi:hypothetical protein